VAAVKRLLAWLEKDSSAKGQRDYAVVYTLVTSGLRSAELVQLRWKDLELFEGTWTARFIGMGNREAEQELYTQAVEACRRYFKSQFKREPVPEDALFWTFPTYRGDKTRPLAYQTLWRRIKEIGKAARELGWSPHLFRRFYATALYKSGMGIKAIQEKTRHTNIDILVRHYIHDEEPASPYFEKMLG
jgi:integrase